MGLTQGLTPIKGWQGPFITELCKTANVSAACRKAKISRAVAYEDKTADKLFAAAWEEALEIATEALELEARRRAEKGVLDPVFYLGGKVGTIRKYSDTLLIFLLKAHKPSIYSEKHQVAQTGDITIRVVHQSRKREDDDGIHSPTS